MVITKDLIYKVVTNFTKFIFRSSKVITNNKNDNNDNTINICDGNDNDKWQ